jgi:16S rRNA C967 or C1407 C5-methylase (RsmB/RsmF family)/NOL1/NOP2/fmu family ribosome biogenesis protein
MYPDPFKERLYKQLGEEAYQSFLNALQEITPTSIRINTKKLDFSPKLERIAWCENGYYLPERPLFAADPLWHAGAYYVQEASSMSLEKAFNKIKSIQQTPLCVLDLCAAPGGKSTHITSLLSENDLLVSNEVIHARVNILMENLNKWGYPNVIITSSDSKDFGELGEIFDIVVVDAPCSGEGLFRKDISAIEQWNEDNVRTCELRQNRILNEISKCVKPNGFIIYSTCTYNPGENEHQIELLINQGFEPIAFELNGETKSTHQFMPHIHKGEGFFIALLQKKDSFQQGDSKKNTKELKKEKYQADYAKLVTTENYMIKHKDEIKAISPHVFEFYNLNLGHLQTYQIGTSIGHLSGSLLLPSDKLVFSQIFNPTVFDSLDLSYEESLSYLGKQVIPKVSSQKGYVVLKYNHINIGLGKFAGNRINNLYPNEWKLRKQISQSDYFCMLKFK